MGTYTVYSTRSNRNIAYNNNNALTTPSSDYDSTIYNVENDLGSIKISTDVYDNTTANATWYIEYPDMQIARNNIESARFHTSLYFKYGKRTY